MQIKHSRSLLQNQLYKTERSKWITGLVAVFTIYTLYYLLFQDSPKIEHIGRKMRHVIKFGTTFLVYLVGTFHLGKLKDEWMNLLWHTVHISGLLILVGIGGFDWAFGMVSNPIKYFAASIQEFLISPVLYVGMGILNKKVLK